MQNRKWLYAGLVTLALGVCAFVTLGGLLIYFGLQNGDLARDNDQLKTEVAMEATETHPINRVPLVNTPEPQIFVTEVVLVVTPTPLPVTATLAPTQVAQAQVLPTATAVPGIIIDAQNMQAVNGSAIGPRFSITGAPQSVDLPVSIQLAEVVSEERMANRGPSEFLNSLGLNTNFMLGDAGVYNTHDLADAEANPSAWLITAVNQNVPDHVGPAYTNLAEGGFIWINGYEFCTRTNGYDIAVTGNEAHVWFVVLSGKSWDHTIDTDFNSSVETGCYNPGFIQIDRFPPGMFLSEGHFRQNVAAAHRERTCGSDGCSGVSVLFLDVKTGAWTVINQPAPDAPFTLVATNWS